MKKINGQAFVGQIRKQSRARTIVLGLLLGLVGVLLSSTSTYAAGGVGGGGSGGGGGGGHQTRNGWGWSSYASDGPGPTDGFRNGANWSNVRATCQGAAASQIYINIVLDQYGDGKGYDYQSSWASFAGHFTTGSLVDHGRARAIDTSTAQNAFNALSSKGVSTAGYVFGSNVAWFCANPTIGSTPRIGEIIGCDVDGSGVAVAVATKSPNGTFNYRVQRRVNGVWGDIPGSAFGATNQPSGEAQRFNISAYTSQGRYYFRVRIRDVDTQKQYTTNEVPAGKCGDWDHRYKAFDSDVETEVVRMGDPVPIETLPQVTPDTPISLTIRIRNDGNARSHPQSFRHRIEYRWVGVGGTSWDIINSSADVTVNNTPSPGEDRTLTGNFNIPQSEATPGRALCFRIRMDNFTGVVNGNDRTVTSGAKWRYSGNGTEASGTIRCLKISGDGSEPTCTIGANPSLVDAGGDSTLTWQSSNATSATLQGAPGLSATAVGLSGTRAVTVGSRTVYTLLVESSTGRGECSTTVEVRANKPYLLVQGGDVYSGAIFEGDDGACTPTTGAINAAIKTNGAYGPDTQPLRQLYGSSGGQYGVFASGAIGDLSQTGSNSFVGNYGYYRPSLANALDSSFGRDARDALFSVIGSGDADNYGYYYGGSAGSVALPCLSVSALRGSAIGASSVNDARQFVTDSRSGVLQYSGDISIPASSVPAGALKTLIVNNGSVTITGNIEYPSSYADPSLISSLTIVADNIYLEANAQIVDVNLVAYPVGGSGGVIDTCSNLLDSGSRVPGQWPASMTIGSCKRQNPSLRLGGSVVARQILWKRTFGTLGTVEGAADPSCAYATVGVGTVAALEQCAAELIQYSPLNYVGEIERTIRGGQPLGSVPVSSQELPPIY